MSNRKRLFERFRDCTVDECDLDYHEIAVLLALRIQKALPFHFDQSDMDKMDKYIVRFSRREIIGSGRDTLLRMAPATFSKAIKGLAEKGYIRQVCKRDRKGRAKSSYIFETLACNRSERYFKYPMAAVALGLSNKALAVSFVLARRADSHGICLGSLKGIGDQVGLGRNAVRTALMELCKKRLITIVEIKKGMKRVWHYKFTRTWSVLMTGKWPDDGAEFETERAPEEGSLAVSKSGPISNCGFKIRSVGSLAVSKSAAKEEGSRNRVNNLRRICQLSPSGSEVGKDYGYIPLYIPNSLVPRQIELQEELVSYEDLVLSRS